MSILLIRDAMGQLNTEELEAVADQIRATLEGQGHQVEKRTINQRPRFGGGTEIIVTFHRRAAGASTEQEYHCPYCGGAPGQPYKGPCPLCPTTVTMGGRDA